MAKEKCEKMKPIFEDKTTEIEAGLAIELMMGTGAKINGEVAEMFYKAEREGKFKEIGEPSNTKATQFRPNEERPNSYSKRGGKGNF